MGAGQSSSSGGAGATPDDDVKTSYYELLGVDRQAGDDVIKKAYRKKALELHPDRNYGNEESATKTFAEVQAAYEVLSDPQERAWYDSHESSILRGQDVNDEEAPTYSNVRMTSADDLARMLRKFNRNVEYTDAPSGFFGYVRETFEQLAKEEDVAGGWENVDVRDYPTFGHKDDEHDDVVKKFYSAWASFATVKSFAWRDKYRLSEAPDRRIRRLMEKENNSARQEGIHEFNEAVRALVAFVRKRDPRYTPSTQSEAERQKTLRDAATAQAARARKANQEKMSTEIPEWTKIQPAEHDELEGTFEEESEEEMIFECVACNKNFKSEKQYEAHERSKKHQKAVQALQKKMKKDNANLDLNDNAAPLDIDEEDYELVDEDVLDDKMEDAKEDASDRDSSPNPAVDNADQTDTDNESKEADLVPTDAAKPTSLHEDNGKVASADASSASEEDDDYASPEAVQRRLQQLSVDSPTTGASEDEAENSKPKMGKAAQKRAKKAAQAATIPNGDETDSSNKCASCNATFPSRTKLFDHIKKEGHAELKTTIGGTTKGKKGKSKVKR